MKHTLLRLLPATLLVLAAGCSDGDDDASFGTVTFSATLSAGASDSGTAIINGSTFFVTAFTNLSAATPTTLMDNTFVEKRNDVWHYAPLVRWPGEAVDFYAFSPSLENAVSITPTRQTADFSCNGSDDFIYAILKNVNRTSGSVNLNFRHALAKATFMLGSSRSDAQVYVNGVTLHGLLSRSTFTWPTAPTGIGSPLIPGTWSPSASDAVELKENVYNIAQTQPEAEPLSQSPTDLNTTMAYYFIPQELNSFDAIALTGAYLQVKVKVVDTSTGLKIWPTDQTDNPNYYGSVRIGLRTDKVTSWQQGTAYTYTVDIAELPTGSEAIIVPSSVTAGSY